MSYSRTQSNLTLHNSDQSTTTTTPINSHQRLNSNLTTQLTSSNSNSNFNFNFNFNSNSNSNSSNSNSSNSNRFNLTSFILRSSRPNRTDNPSNQHHLITPSINHIMPNHHQSPNQPQQTSIEERSKSITYFPVLRRMASRRKDKENSNQSSSNNNPTSTSTSTSSLRIPRNRRSMSQPPPIPSVIRSATDRLRSNHHLSPTQSILSSSHPTPTPTLPHPISVNPSDNLANSILRNNQTVADLSTTINPTDHTTPSEIPLIEPQLQTSSQVQSPTQSTNPSTQSNNQQTHNQSTQSNNNQQTQTLYSLRLVPHLDATRSLHFEPIERKISSSTSLKIGRFTDRSLPNHNEINLNDNRIAFKSKVVSRGHADIFTDQSGQFFIKDTKSSSGTFLNHIRLSAPGGESKPFPLRDGDVLQLGVDYQGGTEEIYRCVKMRVELNRGWQRAANNFNQQASAQLRALGAETSMSDSTAKKADKDLSKSERLKPVSDCCICLFGVTVCQALFIAPCSHVYHFKCIRPLLQMHHPGFSCPLCRTFADLEADVETEDQPEVELTKSNQNQTGLETQLGSPVVISDQIVIDEFNQSSQMDVQATAVGMTTVSSPNGSNGQNCDGDIVMEDNTLFPDRTLHTSPDLNGFSNPSNLSGSLLSRHDTLHTPLIRSTSSNYHPLSNSYQEGGSNGIVVIDRSLISSNGFGGVRNPVNQKKKEDEQMELLNEEPFQGVSET